MTSWFERDPEGENYRRVEARLEFPMLVASILFIPVIFGRFVTDLSPRSERQLLFTGAVLWLAFAFEYLLLLYLSPSRRAMIRTHKLGLLILLLPVLRPLEILRLAPAASGIRRALRTVGTVASRRGLRPYLVCTTGAIFIGAWFAVIFERDQPGATIDHYGDAVWWAFVTCTTVGYGDHFPVTGPGQIVAVVLMLIGIGALSLLTASIAALFVDDEAEDDTDQITERLDRIEALLRAQQEPG
ncbi:MAG: potassium channel family protein [Actinomycetota bacterium]